MKATILIRNHTMADRVQDVTIRETRRTGREYVTLADGVTLIGEAYEVIEIDDLDASDLDGARRY